MLIWKIAIRNLFLHRMKTIVTGLIIVFGTMLAVIGNSFVDAVSGGMQRSLTNSVTADIQIYSSDAKDKLSVMGSMDGNMPDIGYHPDFKKVKETLMAQVENIKDVIPMGVNNAMLNPGNLLDVKLEELRRLFQVRPRPEARISEIKEHIRAIIRDVKESQKIDLTNIFKDDAVFKESPVNLNRALSENFWAQFNNDAEGSIEFLANKIAPLIFDDSQLWLSYIGTVPSVFQSSFSQFEVVKGEMIPEGKRGFLFSDYIHETQIKHRVARKLDQIKKQIEKDKLTIAGSKEIQDKITANVSQAAEIYSQIEPSQLEILKKKLQAHLPSEKTNIKELISEYLSMNDANFMDRYAFFYKEIAPHVVLYKIGVGDVFAITAFSKTGYASSVNLKVYGTYRFKSFESSPLAGSFNIMDMVSFRQLYGFMTADKRAETSELEKEMGLTDLGKDNVEAMFGSGEAAIGQASASTRLQKLTQETFGTIDAKKKTFDTVYSLDEMQNGIFLNAAVILKNPRKLRDSLQEIKRVSEQEKLGVQALDWSESAGMVGQLTILVRAILFLFVFVIFSVAAFIIMNSMLMATLERSREIGTMRAIGAQRMFLLRLFLSETCVLSLVFGIVGAIIGIIFILTIGKSGIPAASDVASFFFSGDRLFLSVNPIHIFIVFVCMTIVTVISTQYPAWRAMKISPLEAMQKSD